MGLEPALKNINVLCGPELLRQTVPQSRAIKVKRRLAVSVSPDFRDDQEPAAGGAQGPRGFIG